MAGTLVTSGPDMYSWDRLNFTTVSCLQMYFAQGIRRYLGTMARMMRGGAELEFCQIYLTFGGCLRQNTFDEIDFV